MANMTYEEKEMKMREQAPKMIEKLDKESVCDLEVYDVNDEWGSNIESEVNKIWKKKMPKSPKSEEEKRFIWKELTAWEKLCCAKLTANDLDIDCDVSLRTAIIYALAFPFVYKEGTVIRHLKPQTENNKNGFEYCFVAAGKTTDEEIFEYRGDTMNSYATTVREFLRVCWIEKGDHLEDMIDKGMLKRNEKEGKKSEWEIADKYSGWEDCILDNYDYFSKILPPEGHEFIRLNHTVGNFIPVPGNFNSPRRGKTQDYWDITLRGIWKWYTCENKEKKNEGGEKVLKEIIGAAKGYEDVDENVRICESWLKVFGDDAKDWNNFVEQNYLQDFVTGEKGNYGEPKELWEGHFGGNVKPKDKDEFSQFFTNASAWILARGERIAIAVKNRLKDKSEEEISDQLFGKNNND